MTIQTTQRIESTYAGDHIELRGTGEIIVNFDGYEPMDITPNSYRDRAAYLREIASMFTAAAERVEGEQ